MNRNDIKAVVEILTKFTLIDQSPEIMFGRSYKTSIDTDGALGT